MAAENKHERTSELDSAAVAFLLTIFFAIFSSNPPPLKVVSSFYCLFGCVGAERRWNDSLKSNK